MVQVFPRVAPEQGTMTLATLQDEDPHIQAGEGRTLADQALMQLLGKTVFEMSNKRGRLTVLLHCTALGTSNI